MEVRVETVLTDIRFGIRMLTKRRVVTLIALLTIAIGVGVNTAVFSVVNAVILRPLPVRNSDRLAVIATERTSTRQLGGVSFPDLQDYRAATATVFEDVAGYTCGFIGLAAETSRSERVLATWITGNYFSTLDLRPALGRLIQPSEGSPGTADPVVVLGHSTWLRRFGGDSSAVGRTVRINGRPVTVVGVAPAGFLGTLAFSDSAVYLPLNWAGPGDSFQRETRSLHAIARLLPGATVEQAQAAMDVVAKRLERQFPETNNGVTAEVVPERLARPLEDNARTNAVATGMVTILVGLVMLIAAGNVTSLVLTRAVDRRREIAVRAAVGAGRSRLVRQLLTESLLLAALGGCLGILLGVLSGSVLEKIRLPGDLPVRFDFSLDWRVLMYSAALVLLTGVIAGLVPALRVSRMALVKTLREGGSNSHTDRHGHRLRSVLLAGQVAVTFVLLLAAALFVRSLVRAQHVDVGFQTSHLLNVSMDLAQLGYTERQGRDLLDEIRRRVLAVPGVEDASFAFLVPMGYVNSSHAIYLEGGSPPAGGRLIAGNNAVDSHYFATMGIPIVHGRGFTGADDADGRRVAIVNEELAGELWPGIDPLGRRFSYMGPDGPWVEVVGVTNTGKYHSLFEQPSPHFYLPSAQYYTALRVLHVRASMAPETLAPAIERIIQEREPDLVLFDVQSMEQALGGGFGLFLVRVAAVCGTVFGTLGLVLALVGMYGIVSYTTGQLTHDFGIRIALGAPSGQVLKLALRQGMAPVIAGIVIGSLGAVAATRSMSGLLFDVKPSDPLTFVSVGLALLVVAFGASYIPARRATKIDPTAALRHE